MIGGKGSDRIEGGYGDDTIDAGTDGLVDYVDRGPGVDAVLVPADAPQVDYLVGCEAIINR